MVEPQAMSYGGFQMKTRDNIEQVAVSSAGVLPGVCGPVGRPDPTRGTSRGLRARANHVARGQSAVIIALCMVVLIAFVGLAVDGGSLYLQRRTAQNASDGAALAGTRTMLDAFDNMLYDTGGEIVDGNAAIEADILDSINEYATLNKVSTDTLQAYFVNQAKQIISVTSNEENACGTNPGMAPCTVGFNGSVPWTQGVKGITVLTEAKTEAFLLGLVGFNEISAVAPATAFMGVAVDSGAPLLPMGFFTNTRGVNNFVVGNNYVLMSGDERRSSGNWGYLNYNGLVGDANRMTGWLECSYNPLLRTQQEWARWCPQHSQLSNMTGPTEYWLGWPDPVEPSDPNDGYLDYRMQWGEGIDGWWINGNPGAVARNCSDLRDFIEDLERRQQKWLVPIIDATSDGGNNTRYHVLVLAYFLIHNSDVDCNPRPPLPGGQGTRSWFIQGYYLGTYSPGSAGRHGDLTKWSAHTVFLDP